MAKIRNKLSLVVGALWLVVAALSFASRNSLYGGTWNHYVWLLWLLGSGIWLWIAFKPLPGRPR